MDINKLLKTFEEESQKGGFALPLEGEKLGVEKVKEIITDGFTAAEGVIALFTGDFSGGFLKLAAVTAKYSQNFMPALQLAWAELKDLDEAETEEVYNHVTVEFDIENNELEAKIEGLLYLPVLGLKEFNDSIEVVRAIAPIVKDPDLNIFEKIAEIGKQVGPVAQQLNDLYNFVLTVIDAFSALRKNDESAV